MWVVIWKAYNEWRCTSMMWDTQRGAEEHAKRLADPGKEYNEHITVRFIELPKDVNARHSNGKPVWSQDGTLLDANGNRSIFDDVDR